MLTAIIETRNDEVALAHLLAALVPAATEGVLREVVVVDHGSEDGTLVVADAAGCTIVTARAGAGDPRRGAAERARGEWLLFLSPSANLAPGWIGEALAFTNAAMLRGDAATVTARYRRGRLVSGWRARLGEIWSWLVADRNPGGGLLIAKARWLAVTNAASVAAASSVSGARRGAA